MRTERRKDAQECWEQTRRNRKPILNYDKDTSFGSVSIFRFGLKAATSSTESGAFSDEAYCRLEMSFVPTHVRPWANSRRGRKKDILVRKNKTKTNDWFATSLLQIVFQRTPCQFCLLKQGALLCRKPTQNFKRNRARISSSLLCSAAPVCFDVMWSKDERCTRGRVCVALK